MSQPVNPHTARPVAGMIGAMIVATVVAGAWYLIGRPNEDVQPVRTVDWSAQVRAARADQLLLTYAPDAIRDGWRATSATYLTGSQAAFHLGFNTDSGDYVGIDESRADVDDLVTKYIDENAKQGPDVQINGQTWQSWSDGGGDYALTRTVTSGRFDVDSVLVGGDADDQVTRDFVATLTTGTVKQTGLDAPAG